MGREGKERKPPTTNFNHILPFRPPQLELFHTNLITSLKNLKKVLEFSLLSWKGRIKERINGDLHPLIPNYG